MTGHTEMGRVPTLGARSDLEITTLEKNRAY